MMAAATTWLRLACLAGAMLAGQPIIGQSAAPAYEVYAVRFADVPFSAGSLVAGADRARMLDIAFTVWAMKGNGRTVLLDAGFYRQKFMERWKPRHYSRPSDALKAGLGIGPDQVTDIVLSHSHWDHADGVDLFPNATIWIQREEYEHYVGPNGEVLHTGGVDAEDAKMFASLKSAGRVKLVDGDAQEILPGLTVYTGGKHTFASQYVGVQTRAGIVVLASDNAYLYENLERRLAIAQTLDAEANLAAQARMLRLAAAPKFVIPGHDAAVFDRFPTPGNGVARIDGAEPQSPRPASTAAQRLIGAWQLVKRTVQANGTTLADPVLGAEPLGRLFYDASGFMTLQMMRQGRKAAIGTPANPKDNTNARVVLGYDAYFGRYTVDERAGTITHRVEGSLFPEDLGKDFVRQFTLEGDTLTLTFTSTADGAEVTRTLVFRRSR